MTYSPMLADSNYQSLAQVVVVANPANTNALILAENAPSIPRENITALTRLDHNRVLGQVTTSDPSSFSPIASASQPHGKL